MQNLISRLQKKGWGEKEIDKALDIIHNAKQLKTPENKFLERRIYWILLLIILVGDFTISVALMPVLVALNGALPYFIIIVLGLIFGFLFELVIRSIEHLERRHHIFLAFIIPLTLLVDFFIVSRISNNIARTLGLATSHNPVLISIVYAYSFAMPYIIYRFVFRIGYYAKA